MSGPFGGSPVLRKEGKHHKFDDLEFWAEDGLICMIDSRNGDCNAVHCREFANRAKAINDEARRATLPSDSKRLQECVLSMYEVWKEAKSQGDPSDPTIMRQKLRERKRAVLITGKQW